MAYTMNDGIVVFSSEEYRKLFSENWHDVEIDGQPLAWDTYDRLTASEQWNLDGDTATVRPTRFISIDNGVTWDNASEFFSSNTVTDDIWDKVYEGMNPEYRQGTSPKDNEVRRVYLSCYLAAADDDLCLNL